MIPLCQAEGLGVIPWSPLARGLLARASTSTGTTTRSGNDTFTSQLYGGAGDGEILAAVARVAAARGVTAAEVALAWLLGNPAVTGPIIGATRIEHLDSAVRAVDLVLSEEERCQLEAPYRPCEVRGIAFSPSPAPR